MSQKTTLLVISLSCLLIAGCATNISGTWQGRGSMAEGPFSFGAVTFAPDGTYTAEAKYGNTTRAVTGTYTVTGDKIILFGEPFGERTYTMKKDDSALVFTDPTSGNSMTLDRFN
ncbi:MAG: hypothetical protein CBC35_04335 [Planctomycetes bacterium TMED75]|nr:hypothetical protein [Planctomycetaceae bacterium]OUU94203.1 MAG: hypothetical protein CBC35_04335 [Planctomycetes bacterium TMED75]